MTFRPLNRTQIPAKTSGDLSFSWATPIVLLASIVATSPVGVQSLDNPPRAAARVTDTQALGSPRLLLTPVAAAPFNQTDWPVVRSLQRLQDRRRVDTSFALLNTVVTPTIFRQPLVIRYTPQVSAAQSTFQPPSIALTTVAVVASPFSQTDWQNPRGYSRSVERIAAISFALINPPIAAPFNQSDWQNPRGYSRPTERQVDTSFALQNTLPAPPFAQTDWTNPVRPTPRAITQYTLVDGRAIYLPVAAVPPIRQYDWPVPKGRPPLPVQFEQPFRINLLGVTFTQTINIICTTGVLGTATSVVSSSGWINEAAPSTTWTKE